MNNHGTIAIHATSTVLGEVGALPYMAPSYYGVRLASQEYQKKELLSMNEAIRTEAKQSVVPEGLSLEQYRQLTKPDET